MTIYYLILTFWREGANITLFIGRSTGKRRRGSFTKQNQLLTPNKKWSKKFLADVHCVIQKLSV